MEEEKARGKNVKAGGAGAAKDPFTGLVADQRQSPVSSWILAFLSIAEGISKVSFFRKMKWKKVKFSTRIY